MHVVIVGNGVAGVNAVRIIAGARVPQVEIDMYTDEAYLYYPRPKLPAFLAGEIAEKELIQYPPAWYERRGIRVHLRQAVSRLDPAAKRLTLANGDEVSYDRLLLANGSRPSVPPFKGTNKAGVFTLRTLADALAIRAYAQQIEQAIVIGGGLLGLEAARALSVLGPAVTVVEFFPRLLPRQLDQPGAELLQGLFEKMGIRVLTDAATEEILGDERAAGVRLKDGRQLAGQMVLISAGIRSNAELAQQAGLAVNRGVLVDAAMRTTAPDIWAAGDVAEFAGRVWGIVPAAIEQARVAGANMAAEAGQTPATYVDIVPSNTLKVVGIDLFSIGVVNPEGDGFQELRRVDQEAGTYEKLVLQNGRIVGAILLGDKTRVGPITELITKGVDVSAYSAQLLERDFDLNALI